MSMMILVLVVQKGFQDLVARPARSPLPPKAPVQWTCRILDIHGPTREETFLKCKMCMSKVPSAEMHPTERILLIVDD